MRILHLADRLTDRGGAYWHLLGVLAHQTREHDVHLAVGCDDGNVRAPCPLSIVPGLEARTREAVAVDALIDRLRPDVVHVHTVVNPEALECVVAARDSVIRVLTVQDHRFFCPSRGKWTAEGNVCQDSMSEDVCAGCFSNDAYFRQIYALTAERLEALHGFRIVVLSRYMKTELVATGLTEDQVRIVPPFVYGLDVTARPDGPPCVLFVGRLVEAKGVRDAVAAWERSGVSLPLVVAGAGPLAEELRRPGVELVGWAPREKLAALYRRAAAVLLPSRWQEPFGIVGLEALTMGTPVVAWESGGVPEWHPGRGLVPWGDVDGLARELRDAIGRRVSPPSRFDPDSAMHQLTEVYWQENAPARTPRAGDG